MARIALFHFVGSFFFSFRSLSGEQKEPREEETPLCPILLRGWVEKHEEVSAGCWSASHSSRQKEECPRCLCRKRLQCRLKGIITGLIVVCFNAVICDPWDSVGRAWITKSLSRLLDFFASWQSLSLFFWGFFFPVPSCHRNALTTVKCARRSMRNLPFKYEPFSNRQPSSSSRSLWNPAKWVKSFLAFFLENEACARAPSATGGLCVLFYHFLNDFHHLAPSKSRGASLAKLHLRLILRIHLSGSIPSFSPQRRCFAFGKRKKKNLDTCIKAFIKTL